MNRNLEYGIEVLSSGVMTVVHPPVGGAMDAEIERTHLTSSEIEGLPILPIGFGGEDGIVDMNNMPTYNQLTTPHCAVYGSLGVIETMLVALYRDKAIYFDREHYALKLREAGILTDKGAYIHLVAWWFHENGVEDTRGNKYKIGRPEPVEKKDIFTVMFKGYPVLTGGFWGWRYHDKNYMWLPKTLSTGFGHCTFLNVGYAPGTLTFPDGTTNKVPILANETSYGAYFGRKKKNSRVSTGAVYVDEKGLESLFTCYIFKGVEKI